MLPSKPNGSTRIDGKYILEKHEGKWIGQHRLRMEKFLGRKLKKGEVVHHKNGDQTNNGIRNLELMLNRAHARIHTLGRIHTEETKEKIRKGHLGLIHTEETKARLRRMRNTPEYHQRQREVALARWTDPEYRQQRIEAASAQWKDPKYKAKVKAGHIRRRLARTQNEVHIK